MSQPPTPLHSAANEEVPTDLPQEKFDDSDFNLNPDLYDDDTGENDAAVGDDVGDDVGTVDADGDIKLEEGIVDKADDGNEVNEPLNDGDGGFIVSPPLLDFSVTTLFDQVYINTKSAFTAPNILNTGQISKLINFSDDSLLQIQRNYIKTHIEGQTPYSLLDLIHDLSLVINVLWRLINSRNPLFGQGDYFIKILSDLEDYLAYYPLFNNVDNSTFYQFFNFLQSIDVKISILIDGYSSVGGDNFSNADSLNADIINGNSTNDDVINGNSANANDTTFKLSQTQIIRLVPIITRLRILIVSKLDQFKAKVEDPVRNLLEVEIGRLFEGILERQ